MSAKTAAATTAKNGVNEQHRRASHAGSWYTDDGNTAHSTQRIVRCCPCHVMSMPWHMPQTNR
jgi:hypothetical protein